MMSNAQTQQKPSPAGQEPDSAVVAQVLQGERARYAILVRRHNQRLFRVARAILRDEAEAEDVVQYAHVTAYRNLEQFRGEASYASWLTRIAVNEALARLRRTKRYGLVSIDDAGGEATMSKSSPDHDAYRAELRRLLEAHIDELPDALRVVFVMREVEELETAETAETLGISEAAVRVRLHRARSLLQERLTRLLSSAPDAYHFAGARCDRLTESVMALIDRDESM
jgi:RNA polymerase sigma factor (sigma-70 family)